jgi:hypothetical protein
LNAFREWGTGNGEREKRELLAEKKYFWKYEMLPKIEIEVPRPKPRQK